MRVIVVGCGKVGTSIASQLSQEGCNVTVIDKNPLHVVRVSDTCDVLGIEGDGSSYKTLEEAGVQEADLVIAVTDSDEKNLLCCLIAKKGGHAATIARVRNPAYSREAAFSQELKMIFSDILRRPSWKTAPVRSNTWRPLMIRLKYLMPAE